MNNKKDKTKAGLGAYTPWLLNPGHWQFKGNCSPWRKTENIVGVGDNSLFQDKFVFPGRSRNTLLHTFLHALLVLCSLTLSGP